MTIRRLCPAVASLALVYVLGQTILGSAPSKPPEAATKTVSESVSGLDKDNKLVLSAMTVPKSGAAVVKSLFPPPPDNRAFQPVDFDEALSLNLGLRAADGTTVPLARRLIQVASGGGDAEIRILKSMLDHGELVVVFSIKSSKLHPELGVWHVSQAIGQSAHLPWGLHMVTDELAYLSSVWSMDSQPLGEFSDKTVGVQIKRGNAGQWSIELSDILRHPTMSPAIFEQAKDRWAFARTRMLGE